MNPMVESAKITGKQKDVHGKKQPKSDSLLGCSRKLVKWIVNSFYNLVTYKWGIYGVITQPTY